MAVDSSQLGDLILNFDNFLIQRARIACGCLSVFILSVFCPVIDGVIIKSTLSSEVIKKLPQISVVWLFLELEIFGIVKVNHELIRKSFA